MEKNDDPETDYMLSPVLTPIEIMKKYPPLELLICEKDPLHDGALKLGLKLAKISHNFRIYWFKYMPHGLLNLALPQGLPEAY